jgi:hypothetical protein
MMVPMTTERLAERGRALLAWEAAGGAFDRLVALDCRVRRGARSDWPGRTARCPEWRAGAPPWAWPPGSEPPGWRWAPVCHGPHGPGCGCEGDGGALRGA